MSLISQFATPENFRKSLEQNLLKKARTHDQDLERIRRKVAFERLLARLFSDKDHLWLLKGGYAMELRIDKARATKDIDLMISDFSAFLGGYTNQKILESLRKITAIDLNDFFEFYIGEVKLDLDSPIYGGARFPVDSRIGGRKFVNFNLDVALGDTTIEPVEKKQSEGWLKEYGVPPVVYHLINADQQFAEKLHAYTLPRLDRLNTRVKDLIDMLLLLEDHIDNRESIQRLFIRYSKEEKLMIYQTS